MPFCGLFWVLSLVFSGCFMCWCLRGGLDFVWLGFSWWFVFFGCVGLITCCFGMLGLVPSFWYCCFMFRVGGLD